MMDDSFYLTSQWSLFIAHVRIYLRLQWVHMKGFIGMLQNISSPEGGEGNMAVGGNENGRKEKKMGKKRKKGGKKKKKSGEKGKRKGEKRPKLRFFKLIGSKNFRGGAFAPHAPS